MYPESPRTLLTESSSTGPSKITRIIETYLDFQVVRNQTFSLELPSVCRLMATSQAEWSACDDMVFNQMLQGLTAAVVTIAKMHTQGLAPKVRNGPPNIRISAGSKIAALLGVGLSKRLGELWVEVFRDMAQDHTPSTEPVNCAQVVILDRRDDMITPLMTPWHYHVSETRVPPIYACAAMWALRL